MFLSQNVSADLMGGLTAAVTAIPLAIAFGVLAFSPLGPDYASAGALAGLYGAIFTGFFAALWGGTPCQVTGPTGPLTTVSTAMVATLALRHDSPETAIALTFLCVSMAGVCQVLLGFLRVGGMIKYIPYPVIAGFMNGIAILIALGQIRPLLGTDSKASWSELLHLQGILPLTLTVGLITMIAMKLTPRFSKKLPGALVGLGLGTLAHHLFAFAGQGAMLGRTIGQIPSGVPHLDFVSQFPALLVAHGALLIPTAIALGLLGSIDSLLTSVVADTVTRTRHDSNRELFGQGMGNLIAGCMGGLAGAGATVRTLVNVAAGGRGRLSGMFHSICLLLVLLFLAPLAGKVPYSVLAGILLVTSYGMLDRWSAHLVWKLTGTSEQKREIAKNLAIVVSVTAVTVFVDLMVAVVVGILLASLIFVERMSRSVIRRSYRSDEVQSQRVLSSQLMQTLRDQGQRTVIFELQGPIFFGTADKLGVAVDEVDDSVDRVILDFHRVTEIDSTGARVLLLIQELLQGKGKTLAFSSIAKGSNHWGFLHDMKVIESVNEAYVFADLGQALEWEEDLLLRELHLTPYAPRTLSELESLQNLQPAEVQALTAHLEELSFAAGSQLFAAGSLSDGAFLLVEGKVCVWRGEHLVASFGPGSVVGEMGLLEGLERTATVVAELPTRAYRLSREGLLQLLEQQPRVAALFLWNLSRELCLRLRLVSRQLEATGTSGSSQQPE